ncbi:nudix hydrolase 13, mitochondrial [Typha latifolia]|uniref:nudix hydrolase 13, mitochondrial n=1 Tax=Typha latifolia TaxID=4733 RepID=UPI003C2DC62D
MASPLLARIGRQRQRYDNSYRLVAGCIPYRLKEEENHFGDLVNRLEVLMVSTAKRNDLVFPKGGWENDETVDQAACREALEEAGVKGKISEDPLGHWIFRSKSSQNNCSPEGACKGYIFALEVNEELDYWPEQASHGRRWVSVMDAYKLCRYEWMCEALDLLLQFLSESKLATSAPELPGPSTLCKILSTAAESAERAIALC